MPKAPTDLDKFESLIKIVSDLRGPEGCPWDKEQDHKTLAPYTIEESYELVEALEQADDQKIKEELGDVLFQVALHSQLAFERKAFTIQDVLSTLNEKMIRRHPHVFSGIQVSGTDEVWKNWEQIKRAEKSSRAPKRQDGEFTLSETKAAQLNPIDIPEVIPALQRAYKIGVKTQKVGFDWSTPDEVLLKVKEELKEVEIELKKKDSQKLNSEASDLLAAEIGDLLFSVAQLARHCGFEPEQTLRAANRKFLNRYEAMHQACAAKGLQFESLSVEEKEKLWSEVKKAES